MNKMLRLPVALAFALGASNAFALGLGQVQVKSSLNQPLLAEIPVLENAPGEAADLQIRLASSEAFARIGLEQPSPALMTSLSFEVTQGEGGKPVIRITTPNRINDPFLSLLIEAEWARGKLLREYTLLLDPPLAVPSRATPSETQPLPQGDVRPAPSESLATPPAATPRPAVASAAPTYVPGESYGPVNAGDSLWKIASQSIPDSSVNINQMMVAIQRANPDAFVGGNINRLRTGAVLRIPSREEIGAVGAREAAQLVREQTSGDTALQPIETDRSPATSAASAESSAPSSDSRLAIVPPRGEQPTAAAQTGAAAGGEGAELRADLARAREQSEALSQENTELKARVQELEKIRGDSERLLELRSSELQALQQRLAEIEAQQAAAAAAASSAPAAAPSSVEAEPAVATEASASSADASAAAEVPASETPATDSLAEAPATEASSEASAEANPSAEPAAEVPAPAAEPPATQPTSAPAETSSENLPPRPPRPEWYENPLVLGGGGALLIGLLALLGLRGRGKKKAAAAAALAPSRFEGADFGVPGSSADADGGHDAHEDAEERELLDRVAEQPDDLERHIDLVRYYYGINDPARFEGAVEAMYAQVYDPDDAHWQQALQMGRDILPDHPLFMDLPAHDAPVSAWEPAAPAAAETSSYETSAYRPDAGFGAASPKLEDEPEFRIDLSEPELVVPEIERPASMKIDESLEPLAFDLEPAPVKPAVETVPSPLASPVEDDAALSADAIEAAATKLELARAYLDMGDVEGARGMLEEVTQEGTAEQRQDARRLLDEIR
jgi:pilus assembly protein FimV